MTKAQFITAYKKLSEQDKNQVKQYHEDMLKAIKTIYFSSSIIILIWLLISYIEIISKNTTGGAIYNDYNIIINMIKIFGGII